MRTYEPEPEEWVEVLRAFPDGIDRIKEHLLTGFGIICTSHSPDRLLVGWGPTYRVGPAWDIWFSIVADRGEEGAADVICQLVISAGGTRVSRIIERHSKGVEPRVRADDSRLVRVLFEEVEWDQPETGLAVVEYWERISDFDDEQDELEPPAEPDPNWEEEDTSRHESESQDPAIDLDALLGLKPRGSAGDESEWSFGVIQTPRRGLLNIPAEWSEDRLEDFMWANWEKLDFGLPLRLHLVQRQANLSNENADRVDFLTRASGGLWIPVELKIKEAGRSALGQLKSYMGDLENAGLRRDKVRGILIAPSFSRKARRIASTDYRVTLLSFSIDG